MVALVQVVIMESYEEVVVKMINRSQDLSRELQVFASSMPSGSLGTTNSCRCPQAVHAPRSWKLHLPVMQVKVASGL